MEAISIDAVLSALPQTGVGGLVVFVIFLLLRRESGTQTRFNEEYERLRQSYESEMSSMREQIMVLQQKIDDLQAKLDAEREERRRAEDAAAEARRGYTGVS